MPHDFSSHVLRRYFEATGWNEANSYLHLTAASAALLDFTIPPGVSLSFSASPAPTFFNTYRLRALPSLRGAFGYIFASIDPERLALDGVSPAHLDIGTSSARVRFKDVVDRFKVHEIPRRPSGRHAVWQGGKRVDSRDYLLYGCIHVPSGRLDALYTTRLAETWQLLVTAVSSPPRLTSAASTLADLTSQQQHVPAQPMVQNAPYPPQPFGQAQGHGGQGYGPGVHGGAPQHPSTAAAAPAAAPDSGASSYGSGSVGPPGSTNLQFTLQHDTGRWCSEYSYSADDALWGYRVLHNFGWPGPGPLTGAVSQQRAEPVAANIAVEEDALGAGLRIGGIGSAPNDEELVGLMDSVPVQEGGTTLKAPDSSSAGLLSSTVDDLTAGGGLRGRFSAGAELFFSAAEKSAGLSTGIRFMTLPEPPIPSVEGEELPPEARIPSQPPTIISATLNPMLGHLSTAYAARMSRNAVVGSRFDFNVYSYESEFTIGAEYWLRSQASSSREATSSPEPEQEQRLERPEPVLVAPPTTASLREPPATNSSSEPRPKLQASLRPDPTAAPLTPLIPLDNSATSFDKPTSTSASSSLAFATNEVSDSSLAHLPPPTSGDTVNGVLKVRFSSSADIALLWEGRLRNCLVSLGVRADLTSRSAPIRSVGLDVLYFGTAGGEPELRGPAAAVAAAAAAAAAASTAAGKEGGLDVD